MLSPTSNSTPSPSQAQAYSQAFSPPPREIMRVSRCNTLATRQACPTASLSSNLAPSGTHSKHPLKRPRGDTRMKTFETLFHKASYLIVDTQISYCIPFSFIKSPQNPLSSSHPIPSAPPFASTAPALPPLTAQHPSFLHRHRPPPASMQRMKTTTSSAARVATIASSAGVPPPPWRSALLHSQPAQRTKTTMSSAGIKQLPVEQQRVVATWSATHPQAYPATATKEIEEESRGGEGEEV